MVGGKGGNVTCAGWQVTLCDPIWHMSSRSGVVLVAQTAIRILVLPHLTLPRVSGERSKLPHAKCFSDKCGAYGISVEYGSVAVRVDEQVVVHGGVPQHVGDAVERQRHEEIDVHANAILTDQFSMHRQTDQHRR